MVYRDKHMLAIQEEVRDYIQIKGSAANLQIIHHHQWWAHNEISIYIYGFTFRRCTPRFDISNTILCKDNKNMLNKLKSDTCENKPFSKCEMLKLLTKISWINTNPTLMLLWTPLNLETKHLFIKTPESKTRLGEKNLQI